MASGLAIVSTLSVGVVDCLRDNENGLLVEPGDVHALAAALHRIIDDHALRTRLADAAYDEVQRLYSWPAVAKQIVGVYEQLRGTQPNNDWNPDIPITPCRFRAEPHLL